MKYLLTLAGLIFSSSLIHAQETSPAYPVLKHYDQDHIGKIALPVGGIGTGTISVGGRGDIRAMEIMNIPAMQYPGGAGKNDLEGISPFFGIYIRDGHNRSFAKCLTGPLDFYDYEAMMGQPVANHGLPRFRNASFDAAYPFGQVHLSDSTLPVDVTIKTFNPLIPADAEASAIPVAIFRFVITNKTDETLYTSVCGAMDNFIGIDGSKARNDFKGEPVYIGASKNKNQFKQENHLAGIYMYSDGVPKNDAAWGTMAMTTDQTTDISYKTSTNPFGSGSTILSFWDDFSDDGKLTNKQYDQPDKPTAALATGITIPPHSKREISFYITWHFPNRFAWSESVVGNYYTTQYTDAWDVIKKESTRLPLLEKKTIQFVSAFLSSDMPEEIKEAALFNLSTIRSQTVFRTPDGKLYGWEGVFDKQGSCFGSCTHVWNYEQVTPFLFGGLAMTMRDTEFGFSTDENGKMSFRTGLPLKKMEPGNKHFAAADGQMGTIMRLYRDWQLSGDDAFLKNHWQSVKKALSYAWIPKGWDSDRDGVMEGCQHNTMDVEYYGPNPQMQLWYLGALKATAAMALYLGDKKFEDTCLLLYKNGRTWTDKHLFNGEYYVQDLRPPGSIDNIDPSLIVGMGASNFKNPEYQLDQGCLVDQLVGQYMADVCNLGYLVDSTHIRTTLKSIMKYDYSANQFDHFNNLRSYVFDNEAGLLMARYPGPRPEIPFPYFNEMMTGFEYVAAIGMLNENQTENGLLCIRNIRDRFDGKKRNPFDEPECGHHYARAMASWGAVLAFTGFHFSAVTRSMSFGKPGHFFWSNGYAWGTVDIKPNGNDFDVELNVLKGNLHLKSFGMEKKYKYFDRELVVSESYPAKFSIK